MKSKITVMRDHLLYATSKAILFVNPKPILPVEGMFKFLVRDSITDPGEKHLVIGAWDGETYIESSCMCKIKGEAPFEPFLVTALKVHQLIKICVDSDIEISMKKKGSADIAVFKTTRSSHEFPTVPDDMPCPSSSITVFKMDLHASDLHAVADTVTNLIDDSDANLAVMSMGVCLQYIPEEEALFFWGGTGSRLSGYKIPMNEPRDFASFIATKKVMKHMNTLFKGNESVEVYFKKNIVEFYGNDVSIKSKVVDYKYPNVYGIFKKLKDHETLVDFSVSELKLSVDKLMLHTDKDTFGVNISFGERSVVMVIDNAIVAQNGVEEVPYLGAEKNAPEIVTTNLKYLQQVLKQSISDRATFAVLPNRSPLLISSVKGDRTILFILGQYKQNNQ